MQHPKKERTLVIIKPDGVQRGLIGEIIKRYESVGLKLVAMKMLVPEEAHVEAHYTLDRNWRRITGEKTIKSYREKGLTPPSEDPLEITAIILKNLKKYLTCGPIVAMVWEGAHAVDIIRKITGGTEPLSSDVGTIRGDYSADSPAAANMDKRPVHNIVHASETPQEARHEIKYWFTKKEIHDYKRAEEMMF